MKPGIEQHPRDPRRAAVEYQKRIPHSIVEGKVTRVGVERDATVEQHNHRDEHEEEKQNESLVVADSNVVANPRTVMIEFLRKTKK